MSFSIVIDSFAATVASIAIPSAAVILAGMRHWANRNH